MPKFALTLAILLLLAAPAAASDRDEGTARLSTLGELAFHSDAGQFWHQSLDPLTGKVDRTDFASTVQETYLNFDTRLTRNVNERMILDFSDRFFGRFASPQDIATARITELDNAASARLGWRHTDKTVSALTLAADHNRTTQDLFADEDFNRLDVAWMIDHALAPHTFLNWTVGSETGAYPGLNTEDYRRFHNRLKLTRYIAGVGRQPACFKYYLLEDMPQSLLDEERWMDLAWDLSLGIDQYSMRGAPATDDHSDFVLDSNWKFALSEFAQFEVGVGTTVRSYVAETVATNRLDFNRNRLHLEFDDWLTRDLKFELTDDFVMTNATNTAGFDTNDSYHAARFEYAYRPYIQWDTEVSGNLITCDGQSAINPDTRDLRYVSDWTRWYGGRTSFTWTEEFSRFRVPNFETAVHSSSRRLRSLLTWSRLLSDDVTLDLGLGQDNTNHDAFQQNDVEERFIRSALRITF